VIGMKRPFRDAAAIALEADVVIGQDTGLMTAAAMERNRKVVLLGHSSAEQITKYWSNTISIEPTQVPCHPCHIVHKVWGTCNQDEATKAAKCMAVITPAAVLEAACA
jgi:ADP-heptose:LPS heptosyltransferase